MTIAYFISQITRYVSILGFIVAILMAYQKLPTEVPLSFDPSKEATEMYSKELIFYITGGTMLVLNMLFLWMSRLFPKLPDGFIKLPGAVKWMFYRKQLNYIITEWMNFGATLTNVLLGASVYILALINDPQETVQLPQFSWVTSAGTFLMIMWMVYIPLRLLLTGPVKE
ncbi:MULTISPECIES: hypothetical protein [unclassified Siphonobacter]|uniref:hypothetical protein n=1 Tax=unclassified Siphonobacter TaxID=2635712 RepID=UPI000CC91273|nr:MULTISPECIES: hypothetical protein [unclassified Siphonobacter]MDQ1088658.1 hypothetical protein [Siphonobacter sp. SORGH_AS_1065]MDR6194805.1 hypothetical protein [Siphonobacter sp. SORGH_AS_0500]PKK35074.1 hypothetical protein BWI96_18640 [Siphonobacter sp. SORGH_AS_0500]